MLISRDKEKKTLLDALQAEDSQFIAVYGRRRVGKTYLIRQTYSEMLTFEHSGLANAGRKEQIQAFTASIKRAGLEIPVMPTNWLDAFELLKDLVEKSSGNKKVLFIDELSWMDTQKSGLLVALENFWNGWASARNDVVLVVCASATSWMLDKVIHNKGGLYNRLSSQIHLKPFKLCECEEYLESKGISISRYDILEMYMAVGGIPYYWSLMKKGRSVAQNIDAMFFADDAPLRDEFKYLYASLFKNPQNYIDIVSALAKKKTGLLRNEIAEETGIPNSGYLTKMLDELISCGFIRKHTVLGKKTKDALYQLTDFYTLFYYQFLQKKRDDRQLMQNSNACLFIFVIMILQESCMKLRKGVYMTQQLHDNRITALYCRLSRDDGYADDSCSIDSQKSMLKEYALNQGFDHCEFFVDDGYSGTNFKQNNAERAWELEGSIPICSI